MLFPLFSAALLFGGTFILLSRVMLFSVQVVVEITAGRRKEAAEAGE